jgi:hypothetical protein
MKYDDASWHSGGNFPKDLPPEAGATHAGMFLAWSLLSGLAGSIHLEDCPESIPMLKERSLTPGVFFLRFCDGKFTDEDLNGEGNSFAQHYFDLETGQYVHDYGETLGFSPDDLYYVPDTWETFTDLSQFWTGGMPNGRTPGPPELRTRPSRFGCDPRVPGPGQLSR